MKKIFSKLKIFLIFLIIQISCDSSPYVNGKWQHIDNSTIYFFNSDGTYALKETNSNKNKEDGTYKLKIRNSSIGDIIFFQYTKNRVKKKYSKKIRLKKDTLELGNNYNDKWTSKYKIIK